MLRSIPQFFRWTESKIPNTVELAQQKFNELTRNQIMQIHPFPDEASLLTAIKVLGGQPNVDASMLQDLLNEKNEEILRMRKRISFLERKVASPSGRNDQEEVDNWQEMGNRNEPCFEEEKEEEKKEENEAKKEEEKEENEEEEEKEEEQILYEHDNGAESCGSSLSKANVPYVAPEPRTPPPDHDENAQIPSSPPTDDVQLDYVVNSIVRNVQTRNDR